MSQSSSAPIHVPASIRRKRRPVNCAACRRSKLRCDRQSPCGACTRRGREGSCSYDTSTNDPGRTISQATAVRSNGDHDVLSTPSVIPIIGGESIPAPRQATFEPNQDQEHRDARWETVLERPVPADDIEQHILSPLPFGPRMSLREIADSLPPKSCCDYLVSHFFKYIFVLFPILHGPTFQRQYIAFMQRPHEVNLSWLALLFSLCSLSLETVDTSDPKFASSLWSQSPAGPAQGDATVSAVSRRLLQTAMTCLMNDQFFIRHTFSTFEALLMVLYNLSHNGSVDQGWALLGMALNMGIALRCNENQNLNPIETERRRRCWAGLLTLHTYQGILFRDVDISYLLNIHSTAPADVNDTDITDNGMIAPPSSSRAEPTQMSVMHAKIRLFRLSTEICHHISGSSRLDQQLLQHFDAAIAAEQKRWDATYTIDGHPSLLDSTSYAYCSCLSDSGSSTASQEYDLHYLHQEMDAMAVRVASLSGRSNICLKAHRALRHLHAHPELPNVFENWTDIRDWMDGDLINWNFDGALSTLGAGSV
ncbi:hypothetical protein BJY04DRAFT_207324 [Aspergillus karnatakaensis]|uniref:uncharacterized protein n=1 Tax=Aspergillus karnatakaensis TaxID=1810916 RepID=UPI003CCD0118